MTDKALNIATQHVRRQGFDVIERAGEKDGQEYFHFWRKATEGHKLGNPLIIKVNALSGKITFVERFDEIMWAFGEYKKLKADGR